MGASVRPRRRSPPRPRFYERIEEDEDKNEEERGRAFRGQAWF